MSDASQRSLCVIYAFGELKKKSRGHPETLNTYYLRKFSQKNSDSGREISTYCISNYVTGRKHMKLLGIRQTQ